MQQDERPPFTMTSLLTHFRLQRAGSRAVILLVLLALMSVAPAAGAATKERFCRATLGGLDHDVRDMRSIKRTPSSGVIQIGTNRLRIREFATRAPYSAHVFGYHVVLPGGSLRYSLKPVAAGTRSKVRVKTVLYATDRNGVPQRVKLQPWSQFGSDAASRTFSSGTLRGEGFYRLDIEIKGSNGQAARFSEYVRVLKPTFGSKLELSSSKTAPSATVYGRLVNSGTASLQYGPNFSVQRRTTSGWARVHVERSIPVAPQLLELLPGDAGSCFAIRLPADALAGTYRIEKLVRSSFTQLTKSISVYAVFHLHQP